VEANASYNKEYHDLINDLSAQKFYGEVMLYFQGGNIENSRTTEHNTKTEIREKMLARNRRRAVVLRTAGGAENGKVPEMRSRNPLHSHRSKHGE
jgi:hypothetical protein